MVDDGFTEEEWLTFAARNECFEILHDVSEDIYSEEDDLTLAESLRTSNE